MNRDSLDKRMQELGIYQDFYYRKELKALRQLLHEGETLNCIFTGVNEGNRKMVAVTDERILIIFAGALGAGEIKVIKRGAVTGYNYEKKLFRSTAEFSTAEDFWEFTGTQRGMKELFDWAMTKPLPELNEPVEA